MRTISAEELKQILENHKHWFNEDCEGWENMRADLHNANLSNANLSNADLRYVDLHNANLCDADLYNADLRYADLHNANLYNANLSNADLYNAKNVPYISMVCPEEGEFIGWKKASNKIIKLKIPKDALRSSATTRKCRCNKAKVLEIYNLDGTIAEERKVRSSYDEDFIYTVGKTVKVKDFDTDRWNECSTGIHFFINRQEAINY